MMACSRPSPVSLGFCSAFCPIVAVFAPLFRHPLQSVAKRLGVPRTPSSRHAASSSCRPDRYWSARSTYARASLESCGAAPHTRGESVDKRADIWAFGCVFYEMLTGRRSFDGRTVSDTLASVLAREPDLAALPTDIPRAVRKLLRRCFEKEPKKRLRDIGEGLIQLEEGLSTPADDEARANEPTPQAVGWRQALPLALAISAVAVVITGLAVWTLRPSPALGSSVRSVISASPSAVPGPPSTQTDLAISPDGGAIVYETIADGQSRVYVLRADRLEGELLPGVENASSLFFSPDGQWVGFSGGLDQSLKKIQVTGGAAISLCPLPSGSRGASWGPDDTIIFAVSGGGNGLFRVSAAGCRGSDHCGPREA